MPALNTSLWARPLLRASLVMSIALLLGPVVLAQTTPDQAANTASATTIGVTGGEPITLQQAVQIALEKNPLRKAALADQKLALSGVKQAQAMLLPHIGFSETATRGNDPVYVFGTKLRQQRFTMQDFALSSLNRPTPIDNFSARFGGEWNLFDSLSSWRNLSRTRFMQQAAVQQLERTDQELVFRVVQAYYGLLLAQKQLDVAEQSNTTAQALLEQAKNRYDSGLVVESDFLSAQVNAASRQQELIRARNALSLAQTELGVALGLATPAAFNPAEALAEKRPAVSALSDLESTALATRPDLKQIRSQESAQQQSVSMAKAAFGPKLNAFGSWESDTHSMFSNGGNNWVAGMELKVDIFAGGARRANLSQQQAMHERIVAGRQTFENQVRLEVRRAFYDFDSACQQVDVTRAASDQAKESLRISRNRYDSGLATITDLLQIQQAMTQAQTNYWTAIYQCRTSYANLQLASGTLNSQSLVNP
ncbi:MAG TPA: TolC family protein [Terriglobales bacterium]|nr:TolC family protein [Terriglobales bacterium]